MVINILTLEPKVRPKTQGLLKDFPDLDLDFRFEMTQDLFSILCNSKTANEFVKIVITQENGDYYGFCEVSSKINRFELKSEQEILNFISNNLGKIARLFDLNVSKKFFQQLQVGILKLILKYQQSEAGKGSNFYAKAKMEGDELRITVLSQISTENSSHSKTVENTKENVVAITRLKGLGFNCMSDILGNYSTRDIKGVLGYVDINFKELLGLK